MVCSHVRGVHVEEFIPAAQEISINQRILSLAAVGWGQWARLPGPRLRDGVPVVSQCGPGRSGPKLCPVCPPHFSCDVTRKGDNRERCSVTPFRHVPGPHRVLPGAGRCCWLPGEQGDTHCTGQEVPPNPCARAIQPVRVQPPDDASTSKLCCDELIDSLLSTRLSPIAPGSWTRPPPAAASCGAPRAVAPGNPHVLGSQ